ncbi:MAG: phenylalanine 4-monooxygenase [Calditrichia bacterium]
MTQNKDNLSAYEKAAQDGLDPRCIPIKLEEPAPEGAEIPYPDYSDEEHETWKILYKRQLEILQERASQSFLEGVELMKFPEDRIPALKDVAVVLQKTTDWSIARVPGLLHEQDFFDFLGRRVFASTDYIRARHELDYTPAPDLFHDIFGHTPMITLPSFADFYQEFGKVAARAKGADRRRLERIYWFTVEFGLIREQGQVKIYGNGILSSYKETLHCLTDQVEKKPFDLDVMSETEYDVWHLQPLLFVIESFDQLQEEFFAWAGKNIR